MWRTILILFPVLPLLMACGPERAAPQPTAEATSLALATAESKPGSELGGDRRIVMIARLRQSNSSKKSTHRLMYFMSLTMAATIGKG